jgi:hypothetical protein
MKARQIERLLKAHVIPELDAFDAKGFLLFQVPIADLLHFFYFSSSGFDKDLFYIDMAVQPLYVPQDDVHFTFGRRLDGTWDIGEGPTPEAVMKRVLAYIQHQGLPFMEQVRAPRDFADSWVLLTNLLPEDPLLREPIAYSLALSGRFEKAIEAVRDLNETEAEDSEPRWPDVTAARVKRLESVLRALEQDPQDAIDLLRMWRLETLANLKLLDYAVDYTCQANAAEP